MKKKYGVLELQPYAAHGTYYYDGNKYKAEDMYDFLSGLILSLDRDYALYCTHLSMYWRDVVKLICRDMGYTDRSIDFPSDDELNERALVYLVSDVGNCYSIKVKNGDGFIITFINASNLFPNISDYDIVQAFGSYDKAIEEMVGKRKKYPLTISSIAQREWRASKNFRRYPLFDCNTCDIGDSGEYKLSDWLRKSYRTGWVCDNGSQYVNKGKGIVIDINSLYPYVMKTKPLPCGKPMYFPGKYAKRYMEEGYYYYIHIKCKFDLKEGYLPYIRLKGNFAYEHDNLATSRKGEYDPLVDLYLSKTDYKLIHEIYNIRNEEIIDGYMFYTNTTNFSNFVDKFYDKKKNATTSGERQVAKMILNSLSGSLGKYRRRTNQILVRLVDTNYIETEIDAPCYIHIASAITSYAREITYRAAMANKDRFIYSDTDSLHLLGWEEAEGVIMGDGLGEWKEESRFIDSRYYKKKIYALLDIHKGWMLKCAGLDSRSIKLVEFLLNYPDAHLMINCPEFYVDDKMDWRAFYEAAKVYDDDNDEDDGHLEKLWYAHAAFELTKTLPVNDINMLSDIDIPCFRYVCKDFRTYRKYGLYRISDMETI